MDFWVNRNKNYYFALSLSVRTEEAWWSK